MGWAVAQLRTREPCVPSGFNRLGFPLKNFARLVLSRFKHIFALCSLPFLLLFRFPRPSFDADSRLKMASPGLGISMDMALEFETGEGIDRRECLSKMQSLEDEVGRLRDELDQERKRNDDLSAHLLTSLDRIEELLEEDEEKSTELKKLTEELARLRELQGNNSPEAAIGRLEDASGHLLAVELPGGPSNNNEELARGNHGAVLCWREGVDTNASAGAELAELEGSYPPSYDQTFRTEHHSASVSSSSSSSDTSVLSDALFDRTEDHEYWTGRYRRLLQKTSSRLRKQKLREARVRKRQRRDCVFCQDRGGRVPGPRESLELPQEREEGWTRVFSVSSPPPFPAEPPKAESYDADDDRDKDEAFAPMPPDIRPEPSHPVVCDCNGSLPLPGPDPDDGIIHNYSPLSGVRKSKDAIIRDLWARHSWHARPPWFWHAGHFSGVGGPLNEDAERGWRSVSAAPMHALGGAMVELGNFEGEDDEVTRFADWCLGELRTSATKAVFPGWEPTRDLGFLTWPGAGQWDRTGGYGNPELDTGEELILVLLMTISVSSKMKSKQAMKLNVPREITWEMGCNCYNPNPVGCHKSIELDTLHFVLQLLERLSE